MKQTNFDIRHDGELHIQSISRNKISRPFDSIGTDPHNKGFPNIYNALEQLSVQSLKLFCILAKVRDYNTNEAVLSRKNLDKKEAYALNRGYEQLEELNILKRVRAETYLFNPDYLIPNTKYRDTVKDKYIKSKAE